MPLSNALYKANAESFPPLQLKNDGDFNMIILVY